MRDGLMERLERICVEEGLSFMGLFGSYAKGKARRGSDVDIAVDYIDKRGKSLFDLLELEERLKRLFRRKVDLGVYDSMNPYVLKDVRKHLRVVYEKR